MMIRELSVCEVLDHLTVRVDACQRDCPEGHNNLSGRLTAIRETIRSLSTSLEARVDRIGWPQTWDRFDTGRSEQPELPL